MLKRMVLNKCTLCATSLQMPLIFVKNHRSLSTRYEGFEYNRPFQPNKILKKNCSREPKRRSFAKPKHSHINAVNLLLEKYNVNIDDPNIGNNIYMETIFTIERRLMLLQEMGVTNLKVSYILNFIAGMYLSVQKFKANFAINPDINVAENLWSYIENPNIKHKRIDHLDETITMKKYYNACFVHYLKHELDLNENQIKRVSYKKYTPVLYNSFRLIQKTLKIMKDVPLSLSTLIKNKYIFGLHPEQALTVLNIINKDLNLTNRAVIQYPKLFVYDLDDLRTLVNIFNQYDITTSMIESCYRIFHLSSAEFKRRIEEILSNPFTLVYQTHPRFLVLVLDYHIIIPRIRYLQDKNLKFATIYTLTTFHNYLDVLTSKKKVNSMSLISFLQSQFGTKAYELYKPLQRHPYYAYAPLVQNLETFNYLKQIYPKEAIYKHIYAILYNKTDLQAAYENIMSDPEYNQWPADKVLALCIYKIEENCCFSGQAVLTPEKYAEDLKNELNSTDKKIQIAE